MSRQFELDCSCVLCASQLNARRHNGLKPAVSQKRVQLVRAGTSVDSVNQIAFT